MQQHRKKTGEKLPSKERNTADKTTAVNNTVMVNINLMIKTANNWWSQGSISHTTQNGSFLRRSSQPISRHSTEKTKPNTTKANNIRTKLEARCFTKHKPHAGRRKCRKILFFCPCWPLPLTLTFKLVRVGDQTCIPREFGICVHISLCTTVVHNTAQNSSDHFHSYPLDNHHGSDNV